VRIGGYLLMNSDSQNKAHFKDVDLTDTKVGGQLNMTRANFGGVLSASVALTALAQLVFMVLEMFFWPFVAERLARMKPPLVQETRALGANLGLYNGFLAAGLLWSLLAPDPFGRQLVVFA
jgi:hypothetical protein